MPSDLERSASRFRAELLAGERRAASRLLDAYGQAYQRIRFQLASLTAEIAQAREAGQRVSPAWLFQRERLQALQRQTAAEIAAFGQLAEREIVAQQSSAVLQGQASAQALIVQAQPGVLVTFSRLPTGAIESLVGVLQGGSPLRELLDALGPEASRAVRDALVQGVALGLGPRDIARMARKALGLTLTRALTIARTETLRAYRESSRQTYQANRDVVQGWIWHAALGTRTCAFCWSMHGTLHRLDEPMSTHPNCRCAMVPAVIGSTAGVTEGAVLFDRLQPAQQQRVLGPAKYRAYVAGQITLDDVRGFARSRKWGRVGFERSLRDILGAEQARRFAA